MFQNHESDKSQTFQKAVCDLEDHMYLEECRKTIETKATVVRYVKQEHLEILLLRM